MGTAKETYVSFCTGGGGLDIGLQLALPNAKCLCYVEREVFPIACLGAAIEEGVLDEAPVWNDMESFPATRFHRKVRGVIGGYPCQPFSVAGRMLGERDPRNLWPHIRRAIRQMRPDWAFFENVSQHLRIGFEQVSSDLEAMDYEVAPPVVWAAEDCGATHKRERLFFLAYAASGGSGTRQPKDKQRLSGTSCGEGGELGNPEGIRTRPGRLSERASAKKPVITESGAELVNPVIARWSASGTRAGQHAGKESEAGSGTIPLWPPGPDDLESWRRVLEEAPLLEPSVCELADGLAAWSHQIAALGNGVVPIQAAVAFCTLVDFARRQIDDKEEQCR